MLSQILLYLTFLKSRGKRQNFIKIYSEGYDMPWSSARGREGASEVSLKYQSLTSKSV